MRLFTLIEKQCAESGALHCEAERAFLGAGRAQRLRQGPDPVFLGQQGDGGSGQQPAYNTALRTLRPVAGPNSQSTLTPSTFGNLNLKPERVFGTELGFEAGTFNDRLGFDFTYYNDVSKDAILSRGVAPGTGPYGRLTPPVKFRPS